MCYNSVGVIMGKILKKRKYLLISALLALGFFYLIFIYHLLVNEERFLYSYIFPFYFGFSIFYIGISYCIKKITLEYQVLGYYKTKIKMFYLSLTFFFILSFLLAIFLYFLTPVFVSFVTGSSLDVFLSREIISISRVMGIIIFPLSFLNLYRGYFSGHRLDKSVFCSYLLEIFLGVVASLLACALESGNRVLIIMWSYFFGSLFSFIYLIFVRYRKRIKFEEEIRKIKEPIFSNKVLFHKLMFSISSYLLFFLLSFINLFLNIWYFSHYLESEKWNLFYTNFSIWTMVFNMFLIAITLFIFFSISFQKEKQKINIFIYKFIIRLIFFLIPLTFLISFLAKPICFLFYDGSIYSYGVLSYSIFGGFFFSLFLSIVLVFKRLKIFGPIRISVIFSFVFKLLLTHPLVNVFNQLGFSSYYGIVTASMLSYFISFIYGLLVLYFQYKILFETIIKSIVDILCSSIIMMIFLNSLKLLIPVYSNNRMADLLLLIFYIGIGLLIYFVSIHMIRFKEKTLFLNENK